MKERTFGIILGIVNIVLLVVCGIFFLGKDKTAPEITLEEINYVYEEDLPENILLQGTTAFDQEDGDVTDLVVIEKIVTDKVRKTATITYGVADSSGNVGKATRTVEMPVAEEKKVELPMAGEAGNTTIVEKAEVETAAETEEDVTPETENAEEEDMAAGDDATEEAASESTNATQTVGSKPDPGRPAITFLSREITVKAGEQPDWGSVMEEIQDDKEDKETLLETLEIKGEYDIEKAGSYYVTLTVTDSDGNASNAYPMKIVVEE